MLDYGIVDGILNLVTMMANPTTRPERWMYETDILEWGEGEGDIQIVVNAVALNADGREDDKTFFPVPVVEEVEGKTFDLAEAIVNLFNATAKTMGKPANWHVYSEPTWWHDGWETDDDHKIQTIQWRIFNG